MFHKSQLRHVLTATLVVACVGLAPAAALAQQIGGTVTDTTGGILPGVTVEARSPSLIERVRTATTDGNGQYLIVALEPGTYSVTYSLPGFGTLIREGIQLSTGFTASIDIQLAVGDIQETVTVSGASPVVDIQNVEQRAVMNREIIDSIPTGKSFQNYALLVPGMGGEDSFLTTLSQDSGGIAGQTLQRIAIHGGDAEDQQLEINGMDVGDSLTQGANYSYFPDSNFEELSFNYSASAAEIESGGVRINMIPREGANEFSGHFFTTFSFPELNADNTDSDLQARGLPNATFIDELWTINPVVGGPIVQDRLWFFVAHSSNRANLLPAGVFLSPNPASLIYAPDESMPSVDPSLSREQSLNLTFQATSKDKIKAYWSNSSTDKPRLLQGRTLASIFVTPEAAITGDIRTNTYQATWTRPQSNALLFEFGYSHLPVRYQLRPAEGSDLTVPGTIQVPGPIGARNMSGWFSGAMERNSPKHTNMLRASVSYVTGSHNLKFGTSSLWLGENAINFNYDTWTSYIVIPGVGPILANFWTPAWQINRARNLGLYAQEQWTLDRLTVNAGVRYDYETSSYPDQITPAATWQPDDLFIVGETANGWHDLQPRLGVAYDLRGDGKTALKFGAHRYGKRNSTDIANLLNPGLNNRSQSRSWLDGAVCLDPAVCIPGDGRVQGDPLNPAPNGELLSSNTNPAFGQPIVNTFFDQDWAFGWGNRQANWELTASVQQELMPGLSLDVAFFRRSWHNFFVNVDRAVGPEDFDTFELQVPVNPDLPGGGGGTITMYDIKPESIRTPDRIFTSADNFGGRDQSWMGMDFTVDGRVGALLVQGGVSTGSTSQNNCEQLDLLPDVQRQSDPLTPLNYCDSSGNWLTQVKFLGSYTLPYDVQIAATLQNQPGPRRVAEVTYTADVLEAALGRPHSLGSIDVDVVDPNTLFGERFSQLDLRLTKIFGFGNGMQLRAMFDLFNLLNANAVTREAAGFGSATGTGAAWLTPQVIMPGRLGKFAFQLDF